MCGRRWLQVAPSVTLARAVVALVVSNVKSGGGDRLAMIGRRGQFLQP